MQRYLVHLSQANSSVAENGLASVAQLLQGTAKPRSLFIRSFVLSTVSVAPHSDVLRTTAIPSPASPRTAVLSISQLTKPKILCAFRFIAEPRTLSYAAHGTVMHTEAKILCSLNMPCPAKQHPARLGISLRCKAKIVSSFPSQASFCWAMYRIVSQAKILKQFVLSQAMQATAPLGVACVAMKAKP